MLKSLLNSLILCVIFLSQDQKISAKTHYAFLIGEYLDDITVYNDTKLGFSTLTKENKKPIIFKYEKFWSFPEEMKWVFFPSFKYFFLGKQIEKKSFPPIHESKNLNAIVEKIKLINPQGNDNIIFFIDGHGPQLTEGDIVFSRKAGGLSFFKENILSWQQIENLCSSFPDCHFFFVSTTCFSGGLHCLSHENSKVSTFTLSGQLNTYTALLKPIRNFFLLEDFHTQFFNHFWRIYKKTSHEESKNGSFLELLFYDLENYFKYPGMQISSFHFLANISANKEAKTFLWKTRNEALKKNEESIAHYKIKVSSFSQSFPEELENLTSSLAEIFSSLGVKPCLQEKKEFLLDKISKEINEIKIEIKKIIAYEKKIKIKYKLAKKSFKKNLKSYQNRKRGSLKQSYKYCHDLSQYNKFFKDITTSFWQVFSKYPLTYLLLDELEQITQLVSSDNDEGKNKFIDLLHHDLSSLEL